MTTRYVLTPLAEADLDQTWDYAAERFGLNVADRVLESLHMAFRHLAENPGIGRAREDLAPAPYSSLAGRAVAHRISPGREPLADR